MASASTAPTKAWQGHEGEVCDTVNGFEVVSCRPCGFKHILPIPTLEELFTAYRHHYYTTEKPVFIERARQDLDWWNLTYDDRYDSIESLLHNKNDRRILDIGSGPGFFLSRGKERGWKTLGFEPSAQAAAHSRTLGLEVREDFLDEKTAKGIGRFDAVNMSEVMEHLREPAKMLELIHGLLNPGGVVCSVVPNDYSPFQQALREACGFKPWWVAPPHHINYFDFDSLSRLFERCGFRVALKEATFPIDLFLLMGDNYVGNDALGRICHGKRMAFEKNMQKAGLGGVKRRLYQALADCGIGREVMVFATRS